MNWKNEYWILVVIAAIVFALLGRELYGIFFFGE